MRYHRLKHVIGLKQHLKKVAFEFQLCEIFSHVRIFCGMTVYHQQPASTEHCHEYGREVRKYMGGDIIWHLPQLTVFNVFFHHPTQTGHEHQEGLRSQKYARILYDTWFSNVQVKTRYFPFRKSVAPDSTRLTKFQRKRHPQFTTNTK